MVLSVEALRFLIPARGILTVAVQLYWPPSDVLSGENVYFTDVVFMSDTTVELEKTIIMSGFDIRPDTTVAEQLMVYCWPALDSPENEMLTFGGGRAEQVRETHKKHHSTTERMTIICSYNTIPIICRVLFSLSPCKLAVM